MKVKEIYLRLWVFNFCFSLGTGELEIVKKDRLNFKVIFGLLFADAAVGLLPGVGDAAGGQGHHLFHQHLAVGVLQVFGVLAGKLGVEEHHARC